MKNKTISIILILIMLLLPFGLLLNVKAEGQQFVITTDANGKVTNTSRLELASINAKFDSNGQLISRDMFSAYKVVDIYYDQTSNSVSYRFTTDFGNYVQNSLDLATIRTITGDQNKTTFTIDDYMLLTDDTVCKSTDENTGECTQYGLDEYNHTPSTLNILASKYAEYISARKGTANAISGIAMDDTVELDAGHRQANISETVGIGGYLILPDSLINNDYRSSFLYMIESFRYGAMVANLYLQAPGGQWSIGTNQVNSKYSWGSHSNIQFLLGERSVDDYLSLLISNMNQALSESDINISFYVGKEFTMILNASNDQKIPVNTHESITGNQTVMNRLNTATVTLPEGLQFTTTSLYNGGMQQLTIQNNNIYAGQTKVATISNNNRVLEYNVAYDDALIIGVISSPNNQLQAGSTNTITFTGYDLDNPYVDIGSNPTEADISKAIRPLTITGTVMTYGLNITNKDSSNNLLSGAEFSICRDAACTDEIASGVTINNGTGSFVGISGNETIYLVQTKAPSGYRLADPVALDLSNAEPNASYYFSGEVVNQPILPLPFTGGSGTAIYTAIGLLIVVGAGIFLVLYKKKNNKDEKK